MFLRSFSTLRRREDNGHPTVNPAHRRLRATGALVAGQAGLDPAIGSETLENVKVGDRGRQGTEYGVGYGYASDGA